MGIYASWRKSSVMEVSREGAEIGEERRRKSKFSGH